MKNLLQFLKDFHRNSGTWVFSATMFNKLMLFFIKVFVIVMLEKEIYGQVAYSISMIGYFLPFIGFGSPVGLMRYGSIAETEQEKNNLINYTFSSGIVGTFLLILIYIPFIYVLDNGNQQIQLFMYILIMRMVGMFLFGYQSAKLRVEMQNKRYGQYDMANSLSLFIFAFALTFLFREIGYLAAYVLAPVVTFLFYGFKFGFPKWDLKWHFTFSKSSFWRYTVLNCIAVSVSGVIYIIDIQFIASILGDKAVAEYSVATLIPLNVMLLPAVFIKADYTKIVANYRNRAFLQKYFVNFVRLFSIFSVGGLFLSFFIGEWMFDLLGKDYQPFRPFMILMLGTCFAMLFRIPLGNMIAAFGDVWYNTVLSLFCIVLSVVFNFLLIPSYGIEGAAWATTITLFISGLMYLAYFIYYLKNECY